MIKYESESSNPQGSQDLWSQGPLQAKDYYTPAEVAKHNQYNDCWVSKFNKVYDLTLLLQDNSGKPECDPIVLAAGTDISHWFDRETNNVSFQQPTDLL